MSIAPSGIASLEAFGTQRVLEPYTLPVATDAANLKYRIHAMKLGDAHLNNEAVTDFTEPVTTGTVYPIDVTYKTGVFPGQSHSAAYVAAGGELYSDGTETGLDLTSGDISIYVLVKHDVDTTAWNDWVYLPSNTDPGYIEFAHDVDGDTYLFLAAQTTTPNSYAYEMPLVDPTPTVAAIQSMHHTAGDTQSYRNFDLTLTTTDAVDPANQPEADAFTPYSSDEPMSFGEIRIYDAKHNDATRNAVIAEMAAEWLNYLSPSSVASSESFGSASVDLSVSPTGISSNESFGTHTVAFLGVTPLGIASSESVPSPALTYDQFLQPTGIDSTETFGTAPVFVPDDITATGIDSTETFGTLNIANVTYPGGLVVNLETSETIATPSLEMESEADLASVTVGGRASYTVVADTPGSDLIGGIPSLTEIAAMDIRAIPNLSVTMPNPALIKGLPYTPDVLASEVIDLSAIGTVYDDPDPVAEEDTGYTMYRYPANTMSSVTGNWSEEWAEYGGEGPSWYSVYPYRPKLLSRKAFLKNNKKRTYSKTLNFHNKYTEHMWLDLGAGFTNSSQGMTVMIAMLTRGYNRGAHNVLDSGKRPKDGIDPGTERKINDNQSSRAAIVVGKKRLYTASDGRYNRGKHIRVPAKHVNKPRVIFSVFNGANSMAGWKSARRFKKRRGNLNVRDFQKLVLGRQKNRLGPEYASNMVVFEVRIWNGPLNVAQIKHVAERMETKYKFNNFFS